MKWKCGESDHIRQHLYILGNTENEMACNVCIAIRIENEVNNKLFDWERRCGFIRIRTDVLKLKHMRFSKRSS